MVKLSKIKKVTYLIPAQQNMLVILCRKSSRCLHHRFENEACKTSNDVSPFKLQCGFTVL